MKLAGFLVGAAAAGVAVWGINAWRYVSDDDRLTTVLRDHCLPYVTTGAVPFVDMGRTPGVYDNVDLRDTTDGGARLIYGDRFIAQWGIVTGAGRSSRLCDVVPTYDIGTISAFEVAADGFVPRYTDILSQAGDLVPEYATVESGPATLGWFDPDSTRGTGLRAVFLVSPGLVSSVVVADDLP